MQNKNKKNQKLSAEEIIAKVISFTKFFIFSFITFVTLVFALYYLRAGLFKNDLKNNPAVVRNIYAEGLKHTDIKDIKTVIGNVKGMPILDFNLEEAFKGIMGLPWIKEATVMRKMPDTIYIEIEERVPVAVFKDEGEYYPIDADGAVIGLPIKYQEGASVLVKGNQGPGNFKVLLSFLEDFPYIKSRLVEAEFIGERRWDIVLEEAGNNIKVKLPEENYDSVLKSLMELHYSKDLFKRDINIIDLRNPERALVNFN